eukprot:TRINITY_DN1792_c0_g6_i5.p1 TRINITY_DN1792_c0_g6~~TRINITY_DN1792_c0_g6_i5.p1  ORF type:complete len:124 (+),score=7.41 TRINITY_DN1792_c0_g6_i5:196-567(+)
MQAKVTAAAQSPARSGPPYGPPLLPLHFYRADGMAAQLSATLPSSSVPGAADISAAYCSEGRAEVRSSLASCGARCYVPLLSLTAGRQINCFDANSPARVQHVRVVSQASTDSTGLPPPHSQS